MKRFLRLVIFLVFTFWTSCAFSATNPVMTATQYSTYMNNNNTNRQYVNTQTGNYSTQTTTPYRSQYNSQYQNYINNRRYNLQNNIQNMQAPNTATQQNNTQNSNQNINGQNIQYLLEMQNLYPEEKTNAFSKNYQTPNKYTNITDLSAIEQIFNGKEIDSYSNILFQIGYDFFNIPSQSLNASTTGKYDSTYRLSIGEKLSLYLYGDSVDVMAISGASLLSPMIKSEVDSKGNIFIQSLGVVPAENKTLGEVEQALNALAAQKYKSLKIKLNVAAGQDFSVFVYGHVNKPGKVMLNNNSSLIDALGAAGGIKKTGSLRNITYKTGKTTRKVDLYNVIFLGNDENIILRPNDKIFVDVIGNVVALKNGVTVPGIYEAKEDENLDTMVKYAGGLLPWTQKTELVITSLDDKTNQRDAKNTAWQNAKTTKIKNGDTVEFKTLYNEVENVVTLQGNVKHPATFAYKEGMRLSDILKSEDELLEETFITQAVIRRITGKDNTIETIPIFLKEFFAGTSNPELRPKDVINVYKNTNISFVDVYGCISTPKHIAYSENMTLDKVLTNVQFVESNVRNSENEIQNVSYTKDENDNAIIEGGATKYERIIPAENVAVEIIRENEDTQLYYLYDIMINSDRMTTILLLPNDKIFFRPLRGNEMIKRVKISGFVKTPGVYNFVEGKRLTDMIEMAGGLTKDADLRGIVYKRNNILDKQVEFALKNQDRDIKMLQGRMASAYQATSSQTSATTEMIKSLKQNKDALYEQYNGQISLDIRHNDIKLIGHDNNIEVQDGDDIYIPRISKHVSVLGEVYNEQSFIYKKGLTAKKYIKAVGGYTPNANKFRIYKVGVNGRAKKIHGWSAIEPGDTIVIPRKIAGNDYITPITRTLQSIASVLVSFFAITKL
jgi:protein involved in polysaccharide export with SLBB domain